MPEALPDGFLIVLLGGAFFAGLVDAIVGGGGLVQVPLLLAALPSAAPATVFGTNKLASVFGTSAAAWRYARSISVSPVVTIPAALSAFLASYAGAMAVAWIPVALLRPLVLVLLVTVAIYTFAHKNFGLAPRTRMLGRNDAALAVAFGSAIGFYDGFFGPGAGSFLIFIFIRFFALDFLRASASAKIVNAGTNLAALLYFAPSGHVLAYLGLGMAVFNIAGSLTGTHLSLRHGAKLVRRVFLAVVLLLIAKIAYDTVVAGFT